MADPTADFDLSTEEAAEILKVSRRTVQRIVSDGRLPALITNPWAAKPVYRVSRKAVEALRKKQQTGPLTLPDKK